MGFFDELVTNYKINTTPATAVRKLQEQHAITRSRLIRRTGDAARQIELLEAEVGELRLVTATLLNLLLKSGTIDLDQLQDVLEEIDLLDGVADGKLDSSIGLDGEERPEPIVTPEETPGDALASLADLAQQTE